MTISTGLAEVQSGLLHGLEAQRLSLRCQHGQSTYFLLPGRAREANKAALDYLWVRHIGRHGCECERAMATTMLGQPVQLVAARLSSPPRARRRPR